MMVMPSKENIKMHEILDPWLMLVGDTIILKEGAPKEAKEMYEIFKQKYGINI